jgi:hypothetical protein
MKQATMTLVLARHFLVLTITAMTLAGCASPATNYSTDMAHVAEVCAQRAVKNSFDRVQCYNSVERPVVTKDLPALLPAYELFNNARVSAATEYDSRVLSATQQAEVQLHTALSEATARLNKDGEPFLPTNPIERTSLIKELKDAGMSSCMKGGLWTSTSMVVNYTCDRNSKLPLLQTNNPGLAKALSTYYDNMLRVASRYDSIVLPVRRAAKADFDGVVGPAKVEFAAEVRSALQADADATAEQRQDVMNLLLGLAQTTVAVAGIVSDVRTMQFCSSHVC